MEFWGGGVCVSVIHRSITPILHSWNFLALTYPTWVGCREQYISQLTTNHSPKQSEVKMKNRLSIRIFLISLLLIVNLVSAQSENPYLDRRQQVLDKMSPKGLLVLQTPRQGNYLGYDFFHQESNLFYLTGMNEPGLILILSKTGIQSPINDRIVNSILITDQPLLKASENDKYFQTLIGI